MGDVEATSYMANERELEFVDLDTYGVDPAAAAILPADLSRHHHVVAVKRKFGTPVIATANPDDLFALDSIRAILGRDFISVVASTEQIDHYLDVMFSGGSGLHRTCADGGRPRTRRRATRSTRHWPASSRQRSSPPDATALSEATVAPLPALDLPTLAGPAAPGPFDGIGQAGTPGSDRGGRRRTRRAGPFARGQSGGRGRGAGHRRAGRPR